MKVDNLLLIRNSKNANKVNNEVALQIRDPNYEFKDFGSFGEIINLINKDLQTLDGKRLSWEQNRIYNSMIKDENLYVKADTSFGKTWLSISVLANKIKQLLNDEKVDKDDHKEKIIELDYNAIFMVSNDILEFDVINEAKKIFGRIIDSKDLKKINISNKYLHDKKINFIVGTAEKIYPIFKRIDFVSNLIVDEAHEIFYPDNERSKFYKLTINEIIKYFGNETVIWMIGAFIKEEDIREFKFDKEFSINVGFKSNFAIMYKYKNKLLLDGLEKKLKETKIPKTEGKTLNFFSTAQDAEENFNKEFDHIKKFNNKMNEYIKRMPNDLSKRWEEYEKRFNLDVESDDEFYFNKTYNVINGIKIGKVLYHAQLPSFLKEFLSELMKTEYIEEIYCTNAILSGVNIDIGKINVHAISHKGGKNELTTSDFLNLAGRSGRYKMGGVQNLAIVEVKNEVDEWWTKNEETLKMRKFSKEVSNDDNKHHIDATLKKISELKDNDYEIKKYLIDPRVHPDIVDYWTSNKHEYLKVHDSLKKVFQDKKFCGSKERDKSGISLWLKKDFVWEIFKPILELYGSKKYKFTSTRIIGEWRKKTHYDSLRIFLQFLKCNNEKTIFTNKKKALIIADKNHKIFNGSETISEKWRSFSNMFNTDIKFGLSSYLSHFLNMREFVMDSSSENNITIDDIKNKTDKFQKWLEE